MEQRDKIREAQNNVQGIKDICQIMEAPYITDITESVFIVLEIVCDRILSLLSEVEEQECIKQEE